MEAMEQELLKIAIEYKKEYESTKWWKFIKKNKAYENWQRAIMKYLLYNGIKCK